jgi:PIN domain nuclease of toxin-antitoxin system
VDLLLDTHAALWWASDPSALSNESVQLISNPNNTVWFSAASAWELSIKVRSGKLELNVARLTDQLTKNGVRLLGIGFDDAILAGSLEWSHRDPFDRMLAAQSTRLAYLLVTRDEQLQEFLTNQCISA